ncbi:MAG TPA: hypothetical protein VGJ54_16595 [Streptosporangiaceae bacterium]
MDTPMTPAPGGGPDAAPAAAPKAKIRPGRIWYLVALLVLLAAVAWLVVGLLSLSSHIDSFPRVAIPAGGQITLDHSGGYVVYYEGPGAQSGQIPAFRVRVTPASAGAAVQSLGPYNSSVTYAFGSHQGRAVLSMRVGHPGRFSVETPGGGNVPVGSHLAFGDSIVGGVAGTALPSALLILAGIVALVVIFIIRIVKTSRARSARSAWSPPGAQPAADPDPPLRADPGPPPTAQPEPPPTAQPGPPASAAQPGPPPTADPGPPPDADPTPPPTA